MRVAAGLLAAVRLTAAGAARQVAGSAVAAVLPLAATCWEARALVLLGLPSLRLHVRELRWRAFFWVVESVPPVARGRRGLAWGVWALDSGDDAEAVD